MRRVAREGDLPTPTIPWDRDPIDYPVKRDILAVGQPKDSRPERLRELRRTLLQLCYPSRRRIPLRFPFAARRGNEAEGELESPCEGIIGITDFVNCGQKKTVSGIVRRKRSEEWKGKELDYTAWPTHERRRGREGSECTTYWRGRNTCSDAWPYSKLDGSGVRILLSPRRGSQRFRCTE
jgi:hypothetical protein